jgi:hypothetical protein
MPGIIEAPEENQAFFRDVVYVHIEADEGTSRRLSNWILQERLIPLRGYGYGDPYTYSGFHKPEDAKRIRQWCGENGVAWDVTKEGSWSNS